MNLKDILRTFHPIAEYIFFSSAFKTFSKLNYKLSHETSLNKFKKIEIILSISFSHRGVKLEINNSRKGGKFTHV